MACWLSAEAATDSEEWLVEAQVDGSHPDLRHLATHQYPSALVDLLLPRFPASAIVAADIREETHRRQLRSYRM